MDDFAHNPQNGRNQSAQCWPYGSRGGESDWPQKDLSNARRLPRSQTARQEGCRDTLGTTEPRPRGRRSGFCALASGYRSSSERIAKTVAQGVPQAVAQRIAEQAVEPPDQGDLQAVAQESVHALHLPSVVYSSRPEVRDQ